MGFLLDRARQRKKDFLSFCKPEIIALSQREEPITLKEYMSLRCNSYEQKILYENVDTETLLYLTALYQKHSSGRPLGKYEIAAHYDDALQRQIVPLLVKELLKQSGYGISLKKIRKKAQETVERKAEKKEKYIKSNFFQCPYCKKTKCPMDEACESCTTWVNNKE